MKSALYKDQYFKSPYLLLLLLPLIYEHPFRIFLSTVTNRIQHRCRFVLPAYCPEHPLFTLLSTNPFDIQYRPKVIKYWAASTYPAVWPYSSKDVTLDYFFARTSAERSYLLEEYPQLSHIHLVSSASQRSNSTKNQLDNVCGSFHILYDLNIPILGLFSPIDFISDIFLMLCIINSPSSRHFT